MKTMSMLEFRRDARRALDLVSRGQRLVLTYRGRPIARIEPIEPSGGPPPEDDPLLRIGDFAVAGPGGRLSNRQIDRTVYGA